MTSSTAIPPGPSSWLPSFDEQVYTLSKVDHIRQYNVPRPDYTIHQEKHLRLLDCLALLLVTQGKSDVAAISFEQTSDCVTLYYAKNRGATRSDREYYRKLVLDAMSPRPDISDALYDRIVHGCVVKIRSRLRKLKGALANARIQVSPEADRTGDFYRHMMKQLPHITSPMTNLIDLLSLIRGMDVNKYPIIGLQNICWASYHIGTYENLHEIIVDSTTLEYLKKIGDYFAAARRIKRHMARLNRGRDPNKRVIIQLKEIPCPNLSPITMPSDYGQILNQYAHVAGFAPVTQDLILKACPRAATIRTTGRLVQPITRTVHAECNLAIFMAKRGNSQVIELGLSKGTCWLCERFLHSFAGGEKRFLFLRRHGKLRPGWCCPDTEHPTIQKHMEEIVAAEMHDTIGRIHDARVFDSPAGSDSGDDEIDVEERHREWR